MASLWPTYTPDSFPTHDAKSPSTELDALAAEMALALTPPVWNNNTANADQSDPAHSLHTTPPTLVKLDPTLRYVAVPSIRGHVGLINQFAPSVVPFAAIDGSRTEAISKTVPIVVSTTSVRVEFQEARPPTLPSVCLPKRASHSAFTSLQIQDEIPVTSGVRAGVHTATTTHPSPAVDATRGRALTSAGIAVSFPTSLTLSTRQQDAGHAVEHVITSPESSWTPEQYVATSSPTTNSHAVALTSVSAASNEAPPGPPPLSTQHNRMSTAISEVSSPSMGASRSPTINLAQSPVLGRGRPNGRAPKRSVTDSTAGSISIVQSKYTDMVFEDVPRLHNILAWLFTWILLAGFVVLPSTFSTLEEFPINSSGFQKVLHSIQNLPMYVFSFSLVPSSNHKTTPLSIG